MKTKYILIALAIIIIFTALFLSFFLTKVEREHKLSNRLFAFFLMLTAIDVSGVLFDFFNDNLSNIVMLGKLSTFLQLPTFYLYLLSVCYSDFKLKSKHLIHVIPFVIVNLILLPRFYMVDIDLKINFLENNGIRFEIFFNHVFIHIQIIIYIIAAFTILIKAKKLYLENYAGATMQSLKWLFQLTLALSFFYTIALLKNIFKFSSFTHFSEWLKIGLFLFELVIISWYLFKALNNPSLFRSIDSKLKLVKFIVSEEKISENLVVIDIELLQLKKYMAEEKPFLNPSLTIKDVSKAIEIPVRELSLLINHKLNQHFYDFVNSYRIEIATDILKDTTKSRLTILEILYDVGFNSKSSFNTAFKKHTQTTPTKYRNSL